VPILVSRCSKNIPTLFLLIVVAVLGARAQKDTGAIVGLVRDASGAVVTGAKVTIDDADRGTTQSFATNSNGEYIASPLRIGRYIVTVEKTGFKRAQAGPVQVNIQDRVSVDIQLQLGAATETINVSSQGPQL